MARGKRPVPFRTRKLSLSAPMVLPRRRGGRVGRRRTTPPGTGVGAPPLRPPFRRLHPPSVRQHHACAGRSRGTHPHMTSPRRGAGGTGGQGPRGGRGGSGQGRPQGRGAGPRGGTAGGGGGTAGRGGQGAWQGRRPTGGRSGDSRGGWEGRRPEGDRPQRRPPDRKSKRL